MVPQNAFQALMRRWTSLGAYNAMHLLRVSGPAEPGKWLHAAATAVAPLGFAPPAEVTRKTTNLTESITEELNKPFAPADAPLRFFVIPLDGGDHYFGVTFDHWVSDSQSIRLLMQRIYSFYKSERPASPLPPLRLNTASFSETFGRANPLKILLGSLGTYIRHRRAFRPPMRDPLDFRVHFMHRQLPNGLISRIRSHAKKLHAKVNDVFVAAAALALFKKTCLATAEKSSRDRVGISVAVDIRPFAKTPLDDVFGFYLGYFSVLIREAGTISFDDAVAQVVTQTQPAKSAERVLHLFRSFKMAGLWWDWTRRPLRKALMFHGAMPMMGGISNVNLTDSWIKEETGILDYIRVSPAGPIVPIVFTLTTIRDRLSLCVTSRSTVFTSEETEAIVADFVQRLAEIPAD